MKDTRINRINSEVKKVVSSMILNELKNPNISLLTSVTEVKVSKDLMFADIYISVLGSEKERENTLEALNQSKGFIRNSIGKKIGLRLTPEPRFKLDKSIEEGIRMNKLIRETLKKDSER